MCFVVIEIFSFIGWVRVFMMILGKGIKNIMNNSGNYMVFSCFGLCMSKINFVSSGMMEFIFSSRIFMVLLMVYDSVVKMIKI